MRVTSSLFVAALIRRAGIAGVSVLVVRHGAEEAGAIFLSVDRLDGTVDLYAPAAQALLMEDGDLPTGRLFTPVATRVADAEVAARMAREVRFDPDLWLVAVEDRDGRPFVELAKG